MMRNKTVIVSCVTFLILLAPIVFAETIYDAHINGGKADWTLQNGNYVSTYGKIPQSKWDTYLAPGRESRDFREYAQGVIQDNLNNYWQRTSDGDYQYWSSDNQWVTQTKGIPPEISYTLGPKLNPEVGQDSTVLLSPLPKQNAGPANPVGENYQLQQTLNNPQIGDVVEYGDKQYVYQDGTWEEQNADGTPTGIGLTTDDLKQLTGTNSNPSSGIPAGTKTPTTLDDYWNSKDYTVQYDKDADVYIFTGKDGNPIEIPNDGKTRNIKDRNKNIKKGTSGEDWSWLDNIDPTKYYTDKDGYEWEYDPVSSDFLKCKDKNCVPGDPPTRVLNYFKKNAEDNKLDNLARERFSKARVWAELLNPSIGAMQIGRDLEKLVWKKDVSMFDLFSDGNFKNKMIDFFSYFQAGVETLWCNKKASSFFTQDYPGHYVGAGDFPNLNSVTIFTFGKRTQYMPGKDLDWNTPYRVKGEMPAWFPNVQSSTPVSTVSTTVTTKSSTTTLILSKANPSLSAAGFLYKLQWLIKHPNTKEEIDAMSVAKRTGSGFDTDGNITFTINIKEEGLPCMYKNCVQISPKQYLEPGGSISQTKVSYKLAYLTGICLKFDTYKWDRYNTEYPIGCINPKGSNMGVIVDQEEWSSQYINLNTLSPTGGATSGGSDWDW